MCIYICIYLYLVCGHTYLSLALCTYMYIYIGAALPIGELKKRRRRQVLIESHQERQGQTTIHQVKITEGEGE